MAPLFDTLDTASTLFVREEYARVIPLLRRILAEDPHNLDAALRLATAHSALGQQARFSGGAVHASEAPERDLSVQISGWMLMEAAHTLSG